jgi:hypothetical protein
VGHLGTRRSVARHGRRTGEKRDSTLGTHVKELRRDGL